MLRKFELDIALYTRCERLGKLTNEAITFVTNSLRELRHPVLARHGVGGARDKGRRSPRPWQPAAGELLRCRQMIERGL